MEPAEQRADVPTAVRGHGGAPVNGPVECHGAALHVRDLVAGFGEVDVLDGLSLHLAAGAVHGIAGLNGAGKSTLLDVIAGLHRPRRGTLTLGGRPLQRSDVAYLPVASYFYPQITGREYLGVFLASRGASRARFAVDDWAELLAVPIDRVTDDYSAGMRRKLALIGAIALGRPVLLLDEPSNTLDFVTSDVLARLLRELAAAGQVVALTSHVGDTLAMCDQLHRLHAGRVVETYEASELHRLLRDLRSSVPHPGAEAIAALVRAAVAGAPGSRGQ